MQTDSSILEFHRQFEFVLPSQRSLRDRSQLHMQMHHVTSVTINTNKTLVITNNTGPRDTSSSWDSFKRTTIVYLAKWD